MKSKEAEVRYNVLRGEWVIISPLRSGRPHVAVLEKKERKVPYKKDCPFCKGNESLSPLEVMRIPERNWRIRVVKNIYPAVQNENPSSLSYGVHEVVIETPHHNVQLADMKRKEVVLYVSVLRERFNALKKEVHLSFISVFKNYRPQAGSSQLHSHSQIIATRFIPEYIKRKMRRSEIAKRREGDDLLGSIIKGEELEKRRVIFKGEHFIVISPYASPVPYNTLIISLNKRYSIGELKDKEVDELSALILKIIKWMKTRLDDPPYNAVFHSSPPKKKSYRFYVEIIPRITTLGGFEMGTLTYINTIPPEVCAEEMRKEITL